jgi:hypothetical protein
MIRMLNSISTPLLIVWSILFCAPASAQVQGGRSAFSFLALSPSARVTGLGGSQIAVRDDDVSLAALNPAALNERMSGRLVFNHNFYLADVQHGYVAYGQHWKKQRITWHTGIQYVDYGTIRQADEWGNVTGTIPATELAVVTGMARPLTDRLSLGLNLRYASSRLADQSSQALTADVGLLYVDTARLITGALVIRHAGTQLNTYSDAGSREALPFDISAAVSKRLAHLPFRLTIIAHSLQQWDIRYNDPALQQSDFLPIGGDAPEDNSLPGVDNFFRHLIFNGEFLLGKSEGFRLQFGYNHQRKRELTVRNFRSLAGFSGGVGIKVKRFRVEMGYGAYHLAGGAVHMSIGTNLGDFF